MSRIITNPGIFADDAETTIPATPIVGVSYRNDVTGADDIADGWPFKTIVDSSDFAEIMFQITSLLKLLDKTGILEHSDLIDYDSVPAYAVGTDGEVYKSLQVNGPSTTVVDPVGDISDTWEKFGKDNAILAVTTFEFTGTMSQLSLIPLDTTIPQISEGVSVINGSVTKVSATSHLYFEYSGNIGFNGGGAWGVTCLFIDGAADAVHSEATITGSGLTKSVGFFHDIPTGSTGNLPIDVRAGSHSGGLTMYINRSAVANYGGTQKCTLKVTEIEI